MKSGKKNLPFTLLDAVLLIALIAAGAGIINIAASNLEYRWNWGVIPQYFYRFDSSSDTWVPNLLMQGFYATIRISIWASVLALVIGIVTGLMLKAKGLYPRLMARTYVELVRNTPPLVLIFIFYFFFGNQLMTLLKVDLFFATQPEHIQRLLVFFVAEKSQFSAFISAILTMAIYEGAYMAEIVRAGFESVPKGQWEAADALGFNSWQKYRMIILPQAIKTTLPAMAGQFISTIKDSAIISVISIQELTFQGMELMAATYLTFEIWITITLMYFVLTYTCSLAAARLEKRLNREKLG
jgi:polar amino acid transport system permease protein